MDSKFDPKNVLTVMHHKATSDVLNLLDGFYSNIEDGIFELAYRTDDMRQQGYCFNLMREMRFRRSKLMQAFARRMQQKQSQWLFPDGADANPHSSLARQMARKSGAHFSTVLNTIGERAEFATGQRIPTDDLPISPLNIAQAFVDSCQTLKFDKNAIGVVKELFCRFVLDRMGPVYGYCNDRLEDAGYRTPRELVEANRASA